MKSAPPESVAAHRVNPGEALRNARERNGWSIEDVAAQLNLTPVRLAQLEAGEFDKLPGTTFARGYIRAYGKLLGLDQAQLVQEFDAFTGSNASGSNVHSLGRIEEPVSYSQSILRFVTFGLLLALAGAGFYWWQEQSQGAPGGVASGGIGHVEVEGADGTTQIHPLDEPEDQAVQDAQQGESLSLPIVPPEEAGERPEAVAPSEPAAQAAAPVAQAPAPVAPAAGEGVLRVAFTRDCWTQVTDASGKVLFSALKRAGDSLDVTGKAPLELRLGFARGAQVTYNGAAVDVTPHISGETARLKLGGQ